MAQGYQEDILSKPLTHSITTFYSETHEMTDMICDISTYLSIPLLFLRYFILNFLKCPTKELYKYQPRLTQTAIAKIED